ncbi:hypothetical protein JOF28_001791 [Leucobacter exalbidus]|uniref:Uncharacterized protein n=1 Tax=Leucobacter exalbidus TaxID=662960 RepID=A0A940PWE8_9MICO|nr:hypothetical protein [Leucobacter exalbidus]
MPMARQSTSYPQVYTPLWITVDSSRVAVDNFADPVREGSSPSNWSPTEFPHFSISVHTRDTPGSLASYGPSGVIHRLHKR